MQQVQEFIDQAFKTVPKPYTLVHIDEDGDKILIENQHDLTALKSMDLPKIKLRLQGKQPDRNFEPESASQQE